MKELNASDLLKKLQENCKKKRTFEKWRFLFGTIFWTSIWSIDIKITLDMAL